MDRRARAQFFQLGFLDSLSGSWIRAPTPTCFTTAVLDGLD